MKKNIYIGEAVQILGGMDVRTFNKYVKKGMIKVSSRDPLGHRLFNQDAIKKLAKKASKHRRKGYPIIR